LITESDVVIAVCGLSSLGKSLEEGCFRLAEAEKLLMKSRADMITEADIACILTSCQGGRKQVGKRRYYMVLNQCDDEMRSNQAAHIISDIEQAYSKHIAVTCLK
jgi:hypothetical protein